MCYTSKALIIHINRHRDVRALDGFYFEIKGELMKHFKELNLSNELLNAIEEIGYTKPTEIQSQTIPLIMEGHDIIGLSKTGSGKTAAFSIPTLELLDTDSTVPQLLVIAPTRELALQIAGEIKRLSSHMKNVRITTVFGGDSMQRQIKSLRKANIVVGTPGRIQDHIRRRTLILKHLKYLVLDEADEMLNMGFYEDIVNILAKTPKNKQISLFSATMPKEIMKISNTFLKNPKTINVRSKETAPTQINQYFYFIKGSQKKSALSMLIQLYSPNRAIIFTNTKKMADEVAGLLMNNNLNANALHGDMPQDTRLQVMNKFKAGRINFLVATDVAARGIDVDDIDLVINYDLPQTQEYYIHRIGRTGRAGKEGTSITFINSRKQLTDLNQIKNKTKSEIIERTLPSKEEFQEIIIKNKFEGIHQTEIHPMAIKFVDSLRDNRLNDLGIAYLLANHIINETLEQYDLDNMSSNNVINIPLGRKQKVRPKEIVNAIINKININPKDVGDISLFKNHSTVELKPEHADKLIKKSKLRVGQNTVRVKIHK